MFHVEHKDKIKKIIDDVVNYTLSAAKFILAICVSLVALRFSYDFLLYSLPEPVQQCESITLSLATNSNKSA